NLRTVCTSGRQRRVGGAADGQQRFLLVEHVDIDHAHALAGAAHLGGDHQTGFEGRPQVVDAEVYGRQPPAQRHDQRVVADRVDDRRQRAAVPLARTLAALELRLHGAGHGELLVVGIGLGHLQAEEGDEGRVVEHLLQLVLGQRHDLVGPSFFAHGDTTTLPNTSRSSMTRNASRASLSGKTLSTNTLSLPSWTSFRSCSMSVRIQPLEPSTLSSKVQMKRMSSVGAQPAGPPKDTMPPPTS